MSISKAYGDLTLIILQKMKGRSLPKVIAELNNKYKIKVVLKENDYETIEVIKNLNVEKLCKLEWLWNK